MADRSIGYTRLGGGGLRPNTDTLPYRGTSAGGGYSTVEDLLKFATALQTHKLLNAQYTEMLTTGKVDTPAVVSTLMDSRIQSINGTRCFGHGGGAPGMNGELQNLPRPRLCDCGVGKHGSARRKPSCGFHYQSSANEVRLPRVNGFAQKLLFGVRSCGLV